MISIDRTRRAAESTVTPKSRVSLSLSTPGIISSSTREKTFSGASPDSFVHCLRFSRARLRGIYSDRRAITTIYNLYLDSQQVNRTPRSKEYYEQKELLDLDDVPEESRVSKFYLQRLEKSMRAPRLRRDYFNTREKI